MPLAILPAMIELREITSTLEDAAQRLERLEQSLRTPEKRLRLREIEEAMSRPSFWDRQEIARKQVEEMKELRGILDPLDAFRKDLEEHQELFELAREEGDDATLQEIAQAIQQFPARIHQMETMALLSGPHDRENCFFSIHTGAGGSDACEWAEMMLRMYTRFFERRGWKYEELSFVAGEEAGIRGVDLRVIGPYAYGYLRGEVGVHRLVRISPFSGRRETSFAAVDVIPDFEEEIEIEIDEKDLRIDTYRSSGKGGQHVNKTDSAVRITHLPTGIVVAVQNERSQHANKAMAMKILKAKLKAKEEAERAALAEARKAAKTENAWGNQIRNYVLHPYTLVKDTRTGCETGDIQRVLDGDLDRFIDAELRWAVEENRNDEKAVRHLSDLSPREAAG